jgi:hypothetical protein
MRLRRTAFALALLACWPAHGALIVACPLDCPQSDLRVLDLR